MKLASTVLVLSLAGGCVNPRDRFDEFGGRVIDAAPVVTIDAAPIGNLPDITGEWLFGIQPVIAPGSTIRLRGPIDFRYVGVDEGVADISVTPLHRTTGMPVGDPLVSNDVPVASTGEFDAPAQGAISGLANPISGSNLQVDIVLHGMIRSADLLCGTVTGTESNLNLVLDGSTFGAIRIDPATAPRDLPPAINDCPVTEPDAGVPDAMPADADTADAV